MARSVNTRVADGNNAKIKVVYFEAENVSSDLTSAINAFANAIRAAPSHAVIEQRLPAQIEGEKAKRAQESQTEMEFGESEESHSSNGAALQIAPKQPRQRRPFKGMILDNINWDGNGQPFIDYVKHKN